MQHHGLTDTVEYGIWCGVKARCYNPHVKAYQYYGGRGIKVDNRWLGKYGFVTFLKDMGKRPTAEHSIDRKNVSLDYSPENCRWVTREIQSQNKRLMKSNTSGHVGVVRRGDKWLATISAYGTYHRLGLFEKFDDAVRIREAAELKYLAAAREVEA